MRTFRTAAIALGAAAALVLTGCSSANPAASDVAVEPAAATADPNATIHIGVTFEPQSLDDTVPGGGGLSTVFYGNVYESLYRLEEDGSTSLLLAKDVDVSEDGLTYTFTLQDGVKFHSGATLTAEDVKFSIDRVIDPDSVSTRKQYLSAITSVEAPDDHTVVVSLSQRFVSLPYYLSSLFIISHTATDLANSEDGTGPYVLDEWRRGSTLSLTRFDDYWGEPAKNGGAVYHFYLDANAENNALLAGQLDIVTSETSPDSLTQFTDNPKFVISEDTSIAKLLIGFNTQVEPFDDPAVRIALTRAIDRQALLQAAWGDYGQVTGSMVPPTDPWFEDLSDVYPYDPEQAKADLAAAGYPDGFSFTLESFSHAPHPTASAFVKAALAEIGVDVTIHVVTRDEWFQKVLADHDFEATLQQHFGERDVKLYGQPTFYFGYDNPDVQDLFDQAERSLTAEEHTSLMREANRILVEEAASDWLYLAPQVVVSSAAVSGFQVKSVNGQFPAYNITKSAGE